MKWITHEFVLNDGRHLRKVLSVHRVRSKKVLSDTLKYVSQANKVKNINHFQSPWAEIFKELLVSQ